MKRDVKEINWNIDVGKFNDIDIRWIELRTFYTDLYGNENIDIGIIGMWKSLPKSIKIMLIYRLFWAGYLDYDWDNKFYKIIGDYLGDYNVLMIKIGNYKSHDSFSIMVHSEYVIRNDYNTSFNFDLSLDKKLWHMVNFNSGVGAIDVTDSLPLPSDNILRSNVKLLNYFDKEFAPVIAKIMMDFLKRYEKK